MKTIYTFLSLFLLIHTGIKAQLITTTPQFPMETDSVYVYFNATQGSKGLMDYSGDIYAHTGVITDKSTASSDWKYVKTAWGENTADTKLEKISANYYKFKISPDIKSYYGVPDGEKILKLAFVFRSDDATKTGKTETGGDIFYEVYEKGLSIAISSPNSTQEVYSLNDTVKISVASAYADSIQVLLDDSLLYHGVNSTFSQNHTTDKGGSHNIVAKAFDATGMLSDTATFYTMNKITIQNLPSGMHKGINIVGDSSVTLVLWAPYKNYVFALGDFNNWQLSDSSLMKRANDGDSYWITINHLDPNKEYIYQFFVDGNIHIADPYTEKVSDPWNDKYIPDTTYPNLIVYPEGKAQGIASVLQIKQPKYTWQTTNYTAPKSKDLIIYELHIRDFTKDGNFQAVTAKLDYLENLGINAIELMPVSEFEGNDSWGYNPSFYFALDKAYGTKNDYKNFVDECHKRGIAVIQDVVYNHSFSQSPLVQLYWDGTKVLPSNPWYNVNSPNSAYSWGFDFNHQSLATREFIDSSLVYWLSEYKIDGYRFDFAKGFTNTPGDGGAYDASRIAILEQYNNVVKRTNPNAYTILELFADNTEEKELSGKGLMIWGNSNYNYLEAAMGWTESDKSDLSWISYEKRGWAEPNLVGYFESHDEERLMYKVLNYGNGNLKDNLFAALPRAELAAVFMLTVPGPKMIWQFGELGYDYSIDYNDRVGRKPVRWDYFDDNSRKRVYQVYTSLNHLRKYYPAFATQNYTMDVSGKAKLIYLHGDSMEVVVAGNFDVNAMTMNAKFAHTGTWYEYFSGDSIEILSESKNLDFKASEYRIYTDKKIAKPEINAGIQQPISQILSMYPNPTQNYIYLEMKKIGKFQLSLISINGKSYPVKFSLSGKQVKIKTQNLKSGIYILQISTAEAQESKLFIKK